MWKVTPEGWVKGVWWDLRKNMDWRGYESGSNPLMPQNIAQLLWLLMRNAKASEQSPAVLARGKPMNHHRRSQ